MDNPLVELQDYPVSDIGIHNDNMGWGAIWESSRPIVYMILSCVLGAMAIYHAQTIDIAYSGRILCLYASGTLLLFPSLFVFFHLYQALLKPGNYLPYASNGPLDQ